MLISKRASSVKPSSTLELTARAKELKNKGYDIINFGAGDPDFETPSNVCSSAIDAIKSGFTKYTAASGILELKTAICNKFKKFNNINYNTDQIVVSNGTKHSLTNIFNTILEPNDEVIIPTPYWLSYPEIIKLSFGIPKYVNCEKTNDYKITAKQIKKNLNNKTKALLLNSPNNPTGMIYTKEELMEIAKVAVDNDILVISDEVYEYLTYENRLHISIASLGKDIYDRTITCSGLSKTYSMTGWRIGYTGSSLEIAKAMSNIQSHTTSNPNSIAQKAAIEALEGNQEVVSQMKDAFENRKRYMQEELSTLKNINYLKPIGGFYFFVDFSQLIGKIYNKIKIENINQIVKILLDDFMVLVIPCIDFGMSTHIRLSYCIEINKIDIGLRRIKEFLNNIVEEV